MGVDDPSTIKGLLKAYPKNETQIKLLTVTLFVRLYQGHGERVVAISDKVDQYLGVDTKLSVPISTSIATALRLERFEHDSIGNPLMSARLSMEDIEMLVSKSTQSVVNMSFELGDFLLTYNLYQRKVKYPELSRQAPSVTMGTVTTYKDFRGNPMTKEEYEDVLKKMEETEIVLRDPTNRTIHFLDGYAGEHIYENLKALTDICRKYPEKIFVAASGNPTYLNGLKRPDIRKVRQQLEQQGLWPKNLIMVGFIGEDSGVTGPTSFGADIYVAAKDLRMLGFPQASSYATPVVTEVVRQLIAHGVKTQNKVMEGLIAMTQKESVVIQGVEEYAYQILDFSKIKDVLMEK